MSMFASMFAAARSWTGYWTWSYHDSIIQNSKSSVDVITTVALVATKMQEAMKVQAVKVQAMKVQAVTVKFVKVQATVTRTSFLAIDV